MIVRSYKNKISLGYELKPNTTLLSTNSIGIYFENNSRNILVAHFKPLNQEFSSKAYDYDTGVLINFERDLIDEDDIEYVLDVMALCNKQSEFSIGCKEQVKAINIYIGLLERELQLEKPSYVILKTVLKLLLLHLIRLQSSVILSQDLQQKRVFQFLELMEIHFMSEIELFFYTDKMGISLKRLNQILKEKLGMTAKQIIQQRQITEAKRRLVKSNESTKEIAFVLGFESISSFSRFFKKKAGLSPSQFKNEV